MKRVGWSILIGCCLVLITLGYLKFFEKKKAIIGLKDLFNKREQVSVTLKVEVGKNKTAFSAKEENTIEKLWQRIRKNAKGISIERVRDNIFTVKAEKVINPSVIEKVILHQFNMEFIELYTLQDLTLSFEKVIAEIESKNLPVVEVIKRNSSNTEEVDSNLLSAELKLLKEKENARVNTFLDYIQFNTAYGENADGLTYAPQLGSVQIPDTLMVNKWLKEDYHQFFPFNLQFMYGTSYEKMLKIIPGKEDSTIFLYALKTVDRKFNPNPTGEQIIKANTDFDLNGSPQVHFQFNRSGTSAWAQMTRRNRNKPIAMIVDGMVASAPLVNEPIENGICVFSGGFTLDECDAISAMMASGGLPLPVKILESSSSAPSVMGEKQKKILLSIVIFVLSASIAYAVSFVIKPIKNSDKH